MKKVSALKLINEILNFISHLHTHRTYIKPIPRRCAKGYIRRDKANVRG